MSPVPPEPKGVALVLHILQYLPLPLADKAPAPALFKNLEVTILMSPAEELMDAPLAIVVAPVFTRVIFPELERPV